jgi:hypothetical protein
LCLSASLWGAAFVALMWVPRGNADEATGRRAAGAQAG